MRRFPKGENQEAWCLPGGKVELGETVEEALHKEIGEETGLKVNSFTFLTFQDSLPTKTEWMHCINLYFVCSVRGSVRINTESVAHAWLELHTLDGYPIVFRNKEIVREYLLGHFSS